MLKKVNNRQDVIKTLERVSTSDLRVSEPITPANVKDATKAVSEALRGSSYVTLVAVKHK